MVSSLEQGLIFLRRSAKVGKKFCLLLAGPDFSFWFSGGEILDVRETDFDFSPATGEPVFVTIDLKGSKFINQEPKKKPNNFRTLMPIADIPVLQATLKSGLLLEMFEEAANQKPDTPSKDQ
jgi:hypothetical protein